MKKLNLKNKLNFRSLVMVGIFSLALVAVSCNKADDGFFPEEAFSAQDAELKKGKAVKPGNQTIAEIVVASTEAEEPQFTLLLGALEYAGLTGVFTGGEQYTVFAPTDEAFVNLVTAVSGLLDQDILANDGPFAAIDALLGEGTISNVLLYHVVEGRRAANSVVPPRGTRTITTLLGATFTVGTDLGITAVGNTANIIDANISASNGIIHVIDAVILPVDLGL
ncbi:fasciclin domain-containing protein [Mariniphaga sp.]|uniref:fasciclin domain-containing protein n=1 Tax=Mariniphaga sp. TaxID=1954475 RepID=UPI003564249A